MPGSRQCQSCGQDLDSPRAYCPRCGSPQPAAGGSRLGSWAIALSIAFLAASIWYFASVISADRTPRDPAAPPPPAALLSVPATPAPTPTAATTPVPTRAPARAPVAPPPTSTPLPHAYAAEPAEEDEEEITVYVTRTGEKYHRGSCRYLRQSKIPMSLADARLSYDPCSVCDPPAR